MTRSGRLGYYLQIYSEYDKFKYNVSFGVTPTWSAWYRSEVKCPLETCPFPKREWSEAPRPLEPELTGWFPGCTTLPDLCPVGVVREDLRAIVEPYAEDIVWGRCEVVSRPMAGQLAFYTVQVARGKMVFTRRGKGNYHRQCPGCARIGSPNFAARQGLVIYQVAGRPLVCDSHGDLYIEESLAKSLKLRDRIEDLRLFKIPLLEEPEDGWVLPGDPGWTGTLVPPAQAKNP